MSTEDQNKAKEQFQKDQNKFEKEYSETGLWDKISENFKTVGKDLLIKVLQLYYTSMATGTPVTTKALIFAALGYFISPVDFVPDIIPVLGYADDAGIVALVLNQISNYISEEIKKQSEEKLNQWLS